MENKVYTQEEVNEICTQHEAWLKDWHTGKRADFSGANLRGVHLEGRSLREANFQSADIDYVAFNTGNAGNCFDDKQVAELAYHLCSAVLGSRTNSPEVRDAVRKILSLANRAESVKVFGKVQEFNGVKHVTAKESE